MKNRDQKVFHCVFDGTRMDVHYSPEGFFISIGDHENEQDRQVKVCPKDLVRIYGMIEQYLLSGK